MSRKLFALILCFTTAVQTTQSQTTKIGNASVPPLQWINLTGLLGSTNGPPPLKGASLGYDETSRSLLIFGGESQSGFAVSTTFLLNLDTLQWSKPNPPPPLSADVPPARSFAISGEDIAASYRSSHLVAGGLGLDGNPLSDVWEYDYNNQFWTQVSLSAGGPSPRWGAVGGNDFRTAFNAVSLNTTFYLAGGFDGKSAEPVSDLWKLSIQGTLSANNAHALDGSWEKILLSSTLTGKTGDAGVVVLLSSVDNHQRVVSLGGCSTSQTPTDECLDGKDYIIDADAPSYKNPPTCPAPRLQPAVAANMNTASTTSGSQVFMLLGTFNQSVWDDGGGLQKGEVAVLDLSGGTWTRVLPAGDPGAGGKQAFPSPRVGATAFSYTRGLAGNNRDAYTDTIVFGGQDESGNYLSEVWILRAYNSPSSGTLIGGVNANGAGVRNQLMTTCATARSPLPSSGSADSPTPSTPSDSPTPSNTESPNTVAGAGSARDTYDTSVVHKVLTPVSVALLLPAIVVLRLSSPANAATASVNHRTALFYGSFVISLAAFGIGIGGLASAFTSITSIGASPLARRSVNSNTLTTSHGKAGLALFVGLFGLIPILLIIFACLKRNPDAVKGRRRASSNDLAEKTELYPASRVSSPPLTTEEGGPDEPRRRARSCHSLWPPSRPGHGRRSSDSGRNGGATSPTPSSQPSFEVTNRPGRGRHASAHSFSAFADGRPSHGGRHPSDVSAFDGRKSLMGDSDFPLSQMRRGSAPPTPGTAALDFPNQSTNALVRSSARAAPRLPGIFERIVHFLLHAFLLGLCVVSLIALWTRAPKAAFAVFLAWVVIFYCLIIYLASRGMPQESVLSFLIYRVTMDPIPPTPVPSRPLSEADPDTVPFPGGPYSHQPPFHVTHEDEYPRSRGHESVEVDDDPDIDEEQRQRIMEEEMNRRDVLTVTVPKRKLFLTNPS